MIWTEHDAPRQPVNNDVKDELELSERASVNITYSPYRSGFFWIALPYEAEKRFDVNDREGTRRMVLRELLPLAEAALTALRQAVAEIDPPTLTRFDGQTRPAVVEIPECPVMPTDFTDIPDAETLDMVGFANDLLREHRQPEGQ